MMIRPLLMMASLTMTICIAYADIKEATRVVITGAIDQSYKDDVAKSILASLKGYDYSSIAKQLEIHHLRIEHFDGQTLTLRFDEKKKWEAKLYKAVSKHDLDAARRILTTHPDIDIDSYHGWIASVNTQEELMHPRGFTAMSVATYHNDISMVKLLIAHGADLDKPDRVSSYTPLMHAIKRHHLGMIALLLDAGADINGRNKTGYTPLMIALDDGNETIARFLIKHGADTSLASFNGYTPVDIASKRKMPATFIKWLKQHGAHNSERVQSKFP